LGGGFGVAAAAPFAGEDLFEGFLVGFGGGFAFGGEQAEVGVEDGFFYGFDGFAGGCFGQVRRGDLQGVEEQAGAFGVEAAVGDSLGDEGDGGLDGAAVFEGGKLEGGQSVALFGQARGLVGAVVVEAKIFFAETFAAAAVSVGEDVAALEVLGVGVWHGVVPPWVLCR
jgi:hypothetical protein